MRRSTGMYMSGTGSSCSSRMHNRYSEESACYFLSESVAQALRELPDIDNYSQVFEEKYRCKRKADSDLLQWEESDLHEDLLLQLISLQKASGCWELNAALARVFGKTEDELTNQKPAQVDGSVWATLLSLIWLYGYKIQQQIEWQFVAMKAASWIDSQNVVSLSQCVCDGNHLLGCQVKEETLGI
ncbi:von Willebrand factor A domain-containing protein 5A-like isoform X1 [Misgurnus anguillicaudatus]|uniref:von Willebrand factor A domain-containing protein 5A-like isoform X1 n=1 Tax=Misgurnus anguillicaudatus TaxID=75329 RepID=UPI003CCF3073